MLRAVIWNKTKAPKKRISERTPPLSTCGLVDPEGQTTVAAEWLAHPNRNKPTVKMCQEMCVCRSWSLKQHNLITSAQSGRLEKGNVVLATIITGARLFLSVGNKKVKDMAK